jgi:TnpA family transposase
MTSRAMRPCDDREHVEVSALALHLVAATIAYLSTHLVQIVLRDPAWAKRAGCSTRSPPR